MEPTYEHHCLCGGPLKFFGDTKCASCIHRTNERLHPYKHYEEKKAIMRQDRKDRDECFKQELERYWPGDSNDDNE